MTTLEGYSKGCEAQYVLCTYGEEQQSEFMYTRLIPCIQLVRYGTHNIVLVEKEGL